MFTIVGSGFGLYGYLPALIESAGGAVVLPRAYEDKVNARPELAKYRDAIRWVADSEAALAAATGVVLATTPLRQPEWVARCLRLRALKFLVLEKPVAQTPAMAADVLESLNRSGKRYRIGYTLLQTEWASGLRVPDADRFDGRMGISWTFTAHHFSSALRGWKCEHAQGGGVLRFFGIHIVALMARLGYVGVIDSSVVGEEAGQPEQWRAVFAGSGLPECRVFIDSRSPVSRFRVSLDESARSTLVIDLREPFEQEVTGAPGSDRRIGVLKRLLDTFRSDDAAYCGLYGEINRLWRNVEACSTFVAR